MHLLLPGLLTKRPPGCRFKHLNAEDMLVYQCIQNAGNMGEGSLWRRLLPVLLSGTAHRQQCGVEGVWRCPLACRGTARLPLLRTISCCRRHLDARHEAANKPAAGAQVVLRLAQHGWAKPCPVVPGACLGMHTTQLPCPPCPRWFSRSPRSTRS